MPKHRSITQQLQYSIREHITLDHSKYAERAMGVKNRIYSIQNSENMLQTAGQFGKWITKNHPEIKWAKEINSNLVKEYIDAKKDQGQWSDSTIYSKASQLNMIGKMINETYHAHINLKIDIERPSSDHNIRDVAMDQSDLEKIKAALSPESNGRTAVEIGSREGLRIKEIARLTGNHINIEKKVIEVRDGAKNGKFRDVPIRPKDIEYFRELKARIGDGHVTNGVQEDSLNRAIRRAMERENISTKYPLTTNHAIRKSYARERYKEELENGRNEKQAWETVQEELGHGSQFREHLYHVYIGK